MQVASSCVSPQVAFGCVSLPLLTIQLLGWTQPASMGAGDDYHWAVLASQIVNAVPSPVRKILQYEASCSSFVMISSGGWMSFDFEYEP